MALEENILADLMRNEPNVSLQRVMNALESAEITLTLSSNPSHERIQLGTLSLATSPVATSMGASGCSTACILLAMDRTTYVSHSLAP